MRKPYGPQVVVYVTFYKLGFQVPFFDNMFQSKLCSRLGDSTQGFC